MIYATVYDASGKILRTIGAGREADLLLNIGPDEQYILGSYSHDTHYIVDGAACAMPEKPSYPCDFDFASGQWVKNLNAAWANLRAERRRLLQACDWTQVPDAPVDQAAWAAYRQELRDLPSKTDDPNNVVWPSTPNS
jgi:hypothetical protein